ncbi:hypothetical protein P152DRAFT_91124 [Eremomyces bilateralis CBS 781.70]|uniref:Uncharacterized protein n=1 Tax=Eremomyces bilateralis CBS 781.70 TaxID=1392243 RepID=A0A6G1FYH2_9PEZI|nr:uncharacterized protein P152DRAFT_91124 [Eremomyces bilateralis CBS 781.70]KAF1810619.1 hypothetical protein P152DRAFT_91124 [Eremomyces bilateralis CBS 781.70]
MVSSSFGLFWFTRHTKKVTGRTGRMASLGLHELLSILLATDWVLLASRMSSSICGTGRVIAGGRAWKPIAPFHGNDIPWPSTTTCTIRLGGSACLRDSRVLLGRPFLRSAFSRMPILIISCAFVR